MIPIWKQMKSGRLVDIANLKSKDIDFREIAESLAGQMRYAGHFEKPISVAQHTLIVHDAATDNALFQYAAAKGFMGVVSDYLGVYALLHDCHETFIGDITSPAHELIRAVANLPDGRDPIVEAKDRIDAAIYAAAGAPSPSPVILEAVKYLDKIALETERRDFLAKAHRPWPGDPSSLKPLKRIYRLRPAADVADELYARFKTWLPALSGAKAIEAAQ